MATVKHGGGSIMLWIFLVLLPGVSHKVYGLIMKEERLEIVLLHPNSVVCRSVAPIPVSGGATIQH